MGAVDLLVSLTGPAAPGTWPSLRWQSLTPAARLSALAVGSGTTPAILPTLAVYTGSLLRFLSTCSSLALSASALPCSRCLVSSSPPASSTGYTSWISTDQSAKGGVITMGLPRKRNQQ